MPRIPSPQGLLAGKLPAKLMQELLAAAATPHARLLVGPRLGEDAAVLDMGDRWLIVGTDPITFATERIGWYAVHVNANDIAVMGARPLWFSAVVLMPEGCAADDVRAIVEEIAATCRELDIALVGGHTEVTAGLPRPFVIGQMLGEAPAGRVVTKAGLRAGDHVILTHGAAIEGTSLLARELGGTLGDRVEPAVLARARNLLFRPGISVLESVRLALDAAPVHAMHDPTEGGVLGGLWELAHSAGLGLRAWADRIPVFPETRVLCDAVGADPLLLIASGALLVAVEADASGAVVSALRDGGIPATVVAEAVEPARGIEVERNGGWAPLAPPPRDEIARILAR